jgi:DNA polymerase/3'-5' exonuclease PolX
VGVFYFKDIYVYNKYREMIKLKSLLREVKETFKSFASIRGKGASKIATTAEEKGGLSLLTYEHFKVKEPYYKTAVEGEFDKESAIKEFNETYKKISMDMGQMEFQREVGRLEVLGELLIRDKDN